MSDEEVNEQNQPILDNESEDEEIGKRFVKKKRRERKVRKGRMKQERFKIFVRFLVSVGILFGLFSLLTEKGWYMQPDIFVHPDGVSVEILNNKIVHTNKIFAVLKNTKVPHLPIYMARTNHIKKDLMKLKPIENVYIRRYAFPARIQIIVRERIPVILILPDVKAQPAAFFTTDGTLVGKEFLPLDKSYDTLSVLSYGNKGDDYRKWDIKKIKKIQKIAKYVETYSKEPVEYVDLRNPNDIYVKIKSVNIRLGKLDENIFKRIERIPSILPQVKEINQKVKYLDLSWEKVNYLKLE